MTGQQPTSPYCTSNPASSAHRPPGAALDPHASIHHIHSRLPRPRLPSPAKRNAPRPTSRQEKGNEAVEALQRASDLFLRRLEGLADDCEAMADAGIGACMYPRECLAGAGAHAARSIIIIIPFRPSSMFLI